MKLIISICVFALFILNAQPGFSQKEVEISGKKYVVHKVKKKETIYSLCRQYNVTPADLRQANPTMGAVLKARSKIYVPVKKEVTKVEQTLAEPMDNDPEYYYHKVMKGQTIYSISRQYGITANELIGFNPDIANGLATGKVLKIPVKRVESNNSSVKPATRGETAKTEGQNQSSENGYITHTVAAGETFYSLGKKYGVTREQLISLNPSLTNGLPTGARLKIPQQNIPQALPAADFRRHKVEKGETLFSLAARFNLHVSEIKKANPSLYSRALETGEIILIPKLESAASTFPGDQPITDRIAEAFRDSEPGNCDPISSPNQQKYKVGLLLPLYLQGNDKINSSNLNQQVVLKNIDFSHHLYSSFTDSATASNGISIDPQAEGFLEFYEGALLAVDSLKQNGMNVELYVFDASNQNMVLALLQLDVFRELNLIIGPVYPELQHSVASFAAKNRIPMVSPLASTGNYEQNNPYFFKVNPTKEYQNQQTAQYIGNEFRDKNFILLPMNGNSKSTEFHLAELGKQKLIAARQNTLGGRNLFHEYNFQKQGWKAIKPLLDETGENVFMIPSDNEAQVSVAVTNLNALAEDYNVVLIATSNLPKMKSIQTENYHHVRLRYLSPIFVDYTKPLVKRFVSQYREVYAGEPTQFSHQGFDVTYYFLSALHRYGRDFKSCLTQYPMELTQMNFHFRKVAPMGGYMNQSLFVTSYEPSYDILNMGTVVPDSQ